MMQIPSAILNMTATLYKTTGEDSYAVPTYASAVVLTGVYIERTNPVLLGGLGEKESGTMTLYFDSENSYPASTKFNTLDRVSCLGTDYIIRNVMPFYNPMTGDVHHFEIILEGNSDTKIEEKEVGD